MSSLLVVVSTPRVRTVPSHPNPKPHAAVTTSERLTRLNRSVAPPQNPFHQSQETFIVSQADDLTALLVDASDATPHGKCNAVYVGFEPSTEQAAALSAYSAQFKVCTRSWCARK